MRLLRLKVCGTPLFEKACLELDFYAADRVVAREDAMTNGVFHLGKGSIYSLNVLGISGVNASGKTTALNLIRFVLAFLTDSFSMRAIVPGSQFWLGKVDDEIDVEAVFWHEGEFYLLESNLKRPNSNQEDFSPLPVAESFTFGDERLWKLDARRVNRKMIAGANEFKENARLLIDRNAADGEPGGLSIQERRFLSPHDSVAETVVGLSRSHPESPDGRLPFESMPTPIVQAFDSSVEYLHWDGESQVYHLKFKGEAERVLGPSALNAMLSSGTVFGSELVSHSISVLRRGSFLIVDEIEESLNRSLVASVINLFSSPVTNPHGAQLIFSTHYPEILDELHRKDDVYLLVRNELHETRAVKYSSMVKRIENKKSEVILSNFIQGTTPRYPDVQAMREYVRERVNA